MNTTCSVLSKVPYLNSKMIPFCDGGNILSNGCEVLLPKIDQLNIPFSHKIETNYMNKKIIFRNNFNVYSIETAGQSLLGTTLSRTSQISYTASSKLL